MYNSFFCNGNRHFSGLEEYTWRVGKLLVPAFCMLYTHLIIGTRIPDLPFSSFGPSRDYGMDLCLEVYL